MIRVAFVFALGIIVGCAAVVGVIELLTAVGY